LSDCEHLTGAFAVGREAREWLQLSTLAIRARVALGVLPDAIQLFPSFSEIQPTALRALRDEMAAPPSTELAGAGAQ
jgi:hypothetical protein